MNVWVPHLPNGALALSRFPRLAHPRGRVILVLTEVSSMNATRAGSICLIGADAEQAGHIRARVL